MQEFVFRCVNLILALLYLVHLIDFGSFCFFMSWLGIASTDIFVALQRSGDFLETTDKHLAFASWPENDKLLAHSNSIWVWQYAHYLWDRI